MVPVNEDEGMHPQRAFVREIIKLFEYHLEGYDVNIHPDDLGPGKTSILGIEYLALEDDLIQFLFQEKESCLEILDEKGNVKALIRARSPFLGFLEQYSETDLKQLMKVIEGKNYSEGLYRIIPLSFDECE